MSIPDVVGVPQPKSPACITTTGMTTRSSNSASTDDDCVPPSQSFALGEERVGVFFVGGWNSFDDDE